MTKPWPCTDVAALMTRALNLLLCVVVMGCSQTVSTSDVGRTPSVAAPRYEVGDTWTLSNGTVSTVVDIQDDGTVVFTGGLGYVGGARRYRWKDGAVEEAGTREGDIARRFVVIAGSGWQFLSFPLEVGKSWQFSKGGYISGRPHQFTIACRVWSYGDVQTPAGMFKAFRMTVEWTGQTPEYRFSNTHIFWYAPAVKFMVREQSTIHSWELLSYRVR